MTSSCRWGSHFVSRYNYLRSIADLNRFVNLWLTTRAFSGKVGTGFPQKMRQIKNLDRQSLVWGRRGRNGRIFARFDRT
jgi:hypothetical protein